ncbi:carboxypeptidase-like regulatory domain-containing protein [Maribellus maritimus]|uniref:carboxypeptidase-like regulatory domain-containing protein n=1 Tax=Maribellus maritimus TaxID=2870838 RepID=UPI001EEB230D|nr:carboxypeptidase-like regulatory domain-containing protein [Maribellus maritimus]MCG6191052.1 carboxypeptidase-like regulatory domain-containing protein [Maribellus maritimus]
MKKKYLIILAFFLAVQFSRGQGIEHYHAGFKVLNLKDTSRIYKPETDIHDSLHFRPVEIDVWYPSEDKGQSHLLFGDIFKLFEQRASAYGDTNYEGFSEELATFFMAELGLDPNPQKLLNIQTYSFWELNPVNSKKLPVIIYMAGMNGMGFENYKILERLAQEGFIVLSVWSVGKYPGEMSNKITDMLEQVFDAEFALEFLRNSKTFSLQPDFDQIGVLGYSWGGMSSAVLVARNPEIKSFVSFDGSEICYFGDPTDYDEDGQLNDVHVKEILNQNLLKPEVQTIPYLYLESDGKLSGFSPTSDYSYYNLLSSEKRYLRFLGSNHSDFLCIPSILNASQSSVHIYNELEDITVRFFNSTLFGKGDFDNFWTEIVNSENNTTSPINYSERKDNNSERKINGKILDASTREPLPYVNIGILNKERGTITNEKGTFELQMKQDYLNDTLRISMVGYHPEELLISDIAKSDSVVLVYLKEKAETINEVVVYGKSFKKKTLGNKTTSKFISTGFSYDQLGAEMGIKINVHKSPAYVDSFRFNVPYNRLSATSVFRLNFYDEKGGRPGENILAKNIFIEIEPKRTGVISVNLKPYDIVLEDDVFVTLEWVKNNGEVKKEEAIYFSLGLLNNGTLIKRASQAQFKKHSSLGVGFNIDVRQ